MTTISYLSVEVNNFFGIFLCFYPKILSFAVANVLFFVYDEEK